MWFQTPEVAQGPRLALSLGYALFEVVSLMCGGDLVKISASCLGNDFCLSPNVVSGLVGVGLRRLRVSSAAACVAASCEDSLDKVSVAGKNQ